MPSINNIDGHSMEMRTLANCSLDTFAIIEAVKVQQLEELTDITTLIRPVLLTETVQEKNTLHELVEFCRSQYDREDGFKAGFDDGTHTFFFCSLPKSKFENFAKSYPALRGFLESLAEIEYNTLYVNFPEKQKIKHIGTALNKKGKAINLVMEKFTSPSGAKFSIYPTTEFGFNETYLSYTIDRLDYCTFEEAENTEMVKRICKLIQEDLAHESGQVFSNQIEMQLRVI